MSDKKLSAFLQKNKKKKGGAQKQAETQAEAGPTATEEAKDQVAKDAEVIQKQEPTAAKASKGQGESSEDEDEDRDLTYGVIKEVKVNDGPKQQNKVDYFEDKAEQKQATAAAQPKAPSEIKFGGGKPKFGRGAGKGQLRGEFSKGLDDLDDDGTDDKGNKDQADDEGPGGGRQFVNLSSAARVQGAHHEEEKKDSKPTGVKPTFRGKANLKGTGGGQDKDAEDAGGNRTYDFAVAFRGQGDDKREKNEEGKEREGTAPRGGGRGRRGGRGRGGFGPSQAQLDEDDGFEIVRGGRPKPKRQHNDSDSDDSLPQGGGRGGRGRGGRGGFFTNSGKNRAQD